MKTPGTSQFCNMPDSEKSQRPFHVLTKPIGPICNLDCKYCFYLEKEVLYDEAGSKWQMSSEVLETYIRDYIQSNPGDEIHFAWQGGHSVFAAVVDEGYVQAQFGAGGDLLIDVGTYVAVADDADPRVCHISSP